jgi:hypothetical protein
MGLLDKERTIAPPGYDRWLVPPAALAIHLSIGMAYGFSVFWLPLARAVGVHEPVTCNGAVAKLQSLPGQRAFVAAAWTAIAIPLAWGVWITVTQSLALFR